MKDIVVWAVIGAAAVALLIAIVGAVLALLTGHARFIEVAWVSIAASLFALAYEAMTRRGSQL